MNLDHHPMATNRAVSRVRWAVMVGTFSAALLLAGCGTSPTSEGAKSGNATYAPGANSEPESGLSDESEAEPSDDRSQEETCDWDSPRMSGPAEVPEAQDGDLTDVLVGAWQHTHTDEGSGFEEVDNDHRYVFPSPDRMLYCQHVPGVTEHAENAANVVLKGTAIELPGGKYAYTVTAWNKDSLVWDNPVGGGYLYLLQRR